MSLLPNCNQNQCSVSSTPSTSEPPRDLDSPVVSTTSQPLSDVITRDIISTQQAELFITEYRDQFAKYCPYVILPEAGTPLLSLRQESPMLLLAILATTSWKDRAQQALLNEAFLTALSSRLILHGDRDLDLLTGLLVYLNW